MRCIVPHKRVSARGADIFFLQARQDALEAHRRYIVLHKCVSHHDLCRLGGDAGESEKKKLCLREGDCEAKNL